MNIAEIEEKLRELVEAPFHPNAFIFGLIQTYNAPKSTIAKLKQGVTGKADLFGDFVWPKKLFFRTAQNGKAAETVDEMAASPVAKKNAPRFIIATDGKEVSALDTKLKQTLFADYTDLYQHFDFFLPLAGQELYEAVKENEADVKASAHMAKFYDAILEANPDWKTGNHTHELNLFMTRVLFCLFAEDTGIFDKNLFISTLHNAGDDVVHATQMIAKVFEALDTKDVKNSSLPQYAKRFPYVNGGLFRDRTPVPKFSRKSLRYLVEAARDDWREINPDIFGSMIQAVVQADMRGDLGMHYTSVPNIMKVLQPLFLMSLEEEFESGRDSEAKLNKLLDRIHKIRVFDPACGSGNFLIIAYRELRKIETRIFQCLDDVSKQFVLPMSGVKLDSFYGIELDDFACETAKLSLWIAEYQANERFKDVFGKAPPALPLRDGGNIVRGNAIRTEWLSVCPTATAAETFVVGNPPYLGRAQQTKEHKSDIKLVFSKATKKFKKLDLVACWLLKGADYCKATNAKCALVTTNSISQGEQVGLLWPLIYSRGMEIGFAHQSFKWKNNAAKNAGVTCVVIGIRNIDKSQKRLFSDQTFRNVSNISPYLTEGQNLIVYPISNAKTRYPIMKFGNMPADGGNLLLSVGEKNILIADYPQSIVLLRRLYGSQEFIKGIERWCLWIENGNLDLALTIPPIAKRIEASRLVRLKSVDNGTKSLAERPHQFREMNRCERHLLVIPRVSSETRKYLPIGFLSGEIAVSDSAFAIYDAPIFLFSIIVSRLQAVWTAAVGGRLETRLRYSNTLVYNTFPMPELSNVQKQVLEEHAIDILAAREAHPGKTIAWLYGEKMPANLLKAHRDLDETLERIYVGRPFRDDTERLEHLFKLYAQMTKKAEPAKKAG